MTFTKISPNWIEETHFISYSLFPVSISFSSLNSLFKLLYLSLDFLSSLPSNHIIRGRQLTSIPRHYLPRDVHLSLLVPFSTASTWRTRWFSIQTLSSRIMRSPHLWPKASLPVSFLSRNGQPTVSPLGLGELWVVWLRIV